MKKSALPRRDRRAAPRRLCASSGKLRYGSAEQAKIYARTFARIGNTEGTLSRDQYGYICAECDGWHITRASSFQGLRNLPLYVGTSNELQRWAMGLPSEFDTTVSGAG